MQPALINFCFAIFWLCVGLTMLVIEWRSEEPMRFSGALGINPGWLCILFFAFNLFRAWARWSYAQRVRRREEDDARLRQQWERHRTEEPRQPPDPNFKFTDE